MIFSPNVTSLLIGRFLAGVSTGGIFILVPLYITEISQDSLRGTLGSFFILATNAGMLIVYAAGIVFSYSVTPRVLILLPIAFVITFSFFPESPSYLLQKNEVAKAEKSLKFYRSSSKSSQLNENEKLEMEKLMKNMEGNKNKKTSSIWKELSEKNENGETLNIKHIFFID